MATGQELIEDALLDIGIGALGQALPQKQMNHALRIANRMLSKWSAEIGMIYASTSETFTWPSGEASRTIGASGDFSTVRPIEITGFQTRKDNLDYTLSQVSLEQYKTTILKTVSTDYPDVFAYQKAYPLGTLYIFPVPANSLTVDIQSKKALTAITLTGTIAWPDGYEAAFQPNLSVRLAPAFGKSARPELIMEARSSMQAIEDLNEDHNEVWPDSLLPGLGGGGDNIDILTNN